MEDATKEFGPVAERLRKERRNTFVSLGAFVVCIFIGVLLPHDFLPFAIALAFIAWASAFGWLLSGAFSPPCPRCKQSIYKFGAYCPECGAQSLTAGTWFSSAHCGSCNKEIAFGNKHRRQTFKLRVCSHCGVLLDDAGL